MKCGYRYHLQRGLGLSEVEPPPQLADADAPAGGLEARLRGTLVHALLEHADFAPGAPPPGPDDVQALAAQFEAEVAAADEADLLAMSAAFLASPLRDRLAAARAVHREQGFAFALGSGPLVNGFVDVLAEEGDGTALVVDYKSDRIGDADPEALVAASYAGQRRIYALAALRAGFPAVEVAHVFLERPGEPAVARYAAADAAALEAELQADAAAVAGRRLPGRRRAAPRALRELPGARDAVLVSGRADRPRARGGDPSPAGRRTAAAGRGGPPAPRAGARR